MQVGLVGSLADDKGMSDERFDNQPDRVVSSIDGSVISGIAGGIADAKIEKRLLTVLKIAQIARKRTKILSELKLSSSKKNSETYITPLVDIGWLTMTIPNKPTTPKQAYLTTLKGRILLRLISRSDKK